MFKKTSFLLSTLDDFPNLKDPQGRPLPEIALAGRSNVGKSSLINHLLRHKNLAKTSATPGKTQLINFFLADDKILFVDLPGYGFAKAPKETIGVWSKAIDAYLNSRPTLKLLLLLIDCRRDLEAEERSLIAWASEKNIPLLAILTKTDKLSAAELDMKLRSLPIEAIPFSVKETRGRHLLEKKIEQIL